MNILTLVIGVLFVGFLGGAFWQLEKRMSIIEDMLKIPDHGHGINLKAMTDENLTALALAIRNRQDEINRLNDDLIKILQARRSSKYDPDLSIDNQR